MKNLLICGSILMLTASCQKAPQTTNTPSSSNENSAMASSESSEQATGDCYVWLYDGDNFTDDNVQIIGPGEFANLKALPGTSKSWDDEADAMKVGPKSKVTIWENENYTGKTATFNPGEELPDLAFEPRSMKIECQ